MTLHLLHEAIGHRLLEGHQDRWEGAVGDLAQAMWIDATCAGISPHLCLDRYCDCHVALWAEQPEQLPLGDEDAEGWGEDGAVRACAVCHVDHYPTAHDTLVEARSTWAGGAR